MVLSSYGTPTVSYESNISSIPMHALATLILQQYNNDILLSSQACPLALPCRHNAATLSCSMQHLVTHAVPFGKVWVRMCNCVEGQTPGQPSPTRRICDEMLTQVSHLIGEEASSNDLVAMESQ